MLTTLSILSANQGKGIDEKWFPLADSEMGSDAGEEPRVDPVPTWRQLGWTYLFGPPSAPVLPLFLRHR
jgi:hypothetical protein